MGKVGSGKSSLLMAITAEMRKTHGQVHTCIHTYVRTCTHNTYVHMDICMCVFRYLR